MAITEHFDENELLFECRIRLNTLNSEQDLIEALEEYSEAISRIANHVHNDQIYHFGITIFVKRGIIKILRSGTAIDAVRLIARGQNGLVGRNSWKSVCPEFWIAACQFSSLNPIIMSILEKIENLLVHAKSSGRTTDSLWEDDVTQFGEPLTTLLALHDPRFVSKYRLIMNQRLSHSHT